MNHLNASKTVKYNQTYARSILKSLGAFANTLDCIVVIAVKDHGRLLWVYKGL